MRNWQTMLSQVLAADEKAVKPNRAANLIKTEITTGISAFAAAFRSAWGSRLKLVAATEGRIKSGALQSRVLRDRSTGQM